MGEMSLAWSAERETRAVYQGRGGVPWDCHVACTRKSPGFMEGPTLVAGLESDLGTCRAHESATLHTRIIQP